MKREGGIDEENKARPDGNKNPQQEGEKSGTKKGKNNTTPGRVWVTV